MCAKLQFENLLETYQTVLEALGAFGDGVGGLLDDGIGVVLDGAGEVVVVPNLHGFVHRRSQPRHFAPAVFPRRVFENELGRN